MYIVTAKEMYDIDHYAIKKLGMDGRLLMENAGRAVSQKLVELLDKTDFITVILGAGNNGGDGFVIARTLNQKNYLVTVVQVVPDEKIKGDSLYHKNLFMKTGGRLAVINDEVEIRKFIMESDIIIDAILGIGIKGKPRSPIAKVIAAINAGGKRVISVDIPSGLPADEGGHDDYAAVQADHTIVIGAPKQSAFLQHTAPFYGKWEAVSIGLPLQGFQNNAKACTWSVDSFQKSMPERTPYSHKGDHGRGLVIGGSSDMPGSVAMAVKAALRTGAGLITACVPESAKAAICSFCPEATYLAMEEIDPQNPKDIPLEHFDAAVLGMGIGRNSKTGSFVRHFVKRCAYPVIIDADGLYHMKSDLSVLRRRSYPTVITPHPGEMAMLLDISVKELLKRPFHFSREFAGTYNTYVVLKGKHTIITKPDGWHAVNTTGNQGLAKGGSGDVLAGIALAMIMQDQEILEGLANACFVHGKAADLLVTEKHSYHSLMATNVIDGISEVYRTIS